MKDIFAAVACFLLGGFVVLEASGYPRRGDVEMHPGHYPGILGYIMLALGVGLVVKLLMKKGRGDSARPSDIDKPRLSLLVLALALYSFAIEDIGYSVTTFLFVTVAVYLFRGGVRTSLLTGVGAAVVLSVAFRYVFKAPLPTGILL